MTDWNGTTTYDLDAYGRTVAYGGNDKLKAKTENSITTPYLYDAGNRV